MGDLRQQGHRHTPDAARAARKMHAMSPHTCQGIEQDIQMIIFALAGRDRPAGVCSQDVAMGHDSSFNVRALMLTPMQYIGDEERDELPIRQFFPFGV